MNEDKKPVVHVELWDEGTAFFTVTPVGKQSATSAGTLDHFELMQLIASASVLPLPPEQTQRLSQ